MRDYAWHELIASVSAADVATLGRAEDVDSEHPLFILYTSGSTGKPKGVLHTTGGYLVYASLTHEKIFGYKRGDIYWCTADIGSITGHSYLVYGPLAMGATSFMYEGAPNWPENDRFWRIIEKHKVTILYTAPTAIRTFMKWGTHFVEGCDLSSLRLLGSVGEPINVEAWEWYHHNIGKGRCPIVDTWWQTETGSPVSQNPIGLGLLPVKYGSPGVAMPGYEIHVVDDAGHELPAGTLLGRQHHGAGRWVVGQAVGGHPCALRSRRSLLIVW